jgi:translocation and assembly module TamB
MAIPCSFRRRQDCPPQRIERLRAELEGNGDGLRINTLHLSHGKTELSAKGHLAWNPALTWQAEVNGSHLDPSLFLADWPGDLTGTVTTSGQMTPHGLNASFHLPALQGTLRTFPLAGNGELHLQDNQLRIPQLVLQSGGSTLRINGTAAETIDLSLHLDSSNLAELWPGAQGKINAQGRITGKREKPQLDFKLTGSNVGAGNEVIQKLTVETKGTLARDGVFDCTVRAERLQIGNTRMDLSTLQIKGSLHDHSIKLESQSSEFSTGFTLEGNFTDKLWQGTLSQTHFSSQQLGDWQQRQHTPLALSAEKVDIKSLCLASSASASLCVNGSWQAPAGSWQMHGAINAFPLNVLQAGAELPWALEGQLAADIDLTGQQSRILTGKLSSNSNGMSLQVPLPEGGTHQVTWKKNSLQALFADNKVRTVLNSELSDNSMLRTELTLAADQLSKEKILGSPMSGSIQFRIQDLSPLAALTDQMISLSGALHGQFTVNGTPFAPLINGQMELANGQAEIPPLGITLSPLQVKMTSNNQSAQLLATAHSGKGFLQAESSLQLSALTSGPHTIHLSGDTFKAAHLPGLDLDITPDLLLIFSDAQTEVRGTVTIPRARITSIDFHNATAPSNDMVVIDDEEAASTTAPVPLFTDITVVAGEDVHIDAYGLRGNIAGQLTMRGQPGRPQVGNGTLSVHDGSFTVYGKRLKIDIGRLLFTGGPLTNPGIELRSEKKGEKVTTGMIIDGFLQRPEIHFYSSPMMEQAAIVTNLLESTAVGGETRQETGFIGETFKRVGLGWMVPYLQGMKKLTMVDEIKLETGDEYDSYSLVLGSWLTPDFYVSYGKDLAKDSISFNTRYTLGKGFHFLTETGSAHSGGDIKYEFER